ncbi:MAG TPA: TonB-dependent receptor, partial [Sphingomonas sp.]|nr:TonB-dependent receptor [Sphingomonas sp.]
MQRRLAYATLLLLTSQLVSPAALAQTAGGTTEPAQATPPQPADPAQGEADAPQQEVEVSAPGVDTGDIGDIVVVGRHIPNTVRATPQIISVLSTEDIARTGEGDIAGALTRVTGLSV